MRWVWKCLSGMGQSEWSISVYGKSSNWVDGWEICLDWEFLLTKWGWTMRTRTSIDSLAMEIVITVGGNNFFQCLRYIFYPLIDCLNWNSFPNLCSYGFMLFKISCYIAMVCYVISTPISSMFDSINIRAVWWKVQKLCYISLFKQFMIPSVIMRRNVIFKNYWITSFSF